MCCLGRGTDREGDFRASSVPSAQARVDTPGEKKGTLRSSTRLPQEASGRGSRGFLAVYKLEAVRLQAEGVQDEVENPTAWAPSGWHLMASPLNSYPLWGSPPLHPTSIAAESRGPELVGTYGAALKLCTGVVVRFPCQNRGVELRLTDPPWLAWFGHFSQLPLSRMVADIRALYLYHRSA